MDSLPYKDPQKERDRQRRYRKNNATKLRARQRRWRQENPHAEREYSRRYREADPEKERARQRRYREEGKMYAKDARYRARKAGATIGDPAAVAAREAEIRKSRWCVACEAEVDDLHVDHIRPLSKGGAHSVENIQGLCARHNLEKSNRL